MADTTNSVGSAPKFSDFLTSGTLLLFASLCVAGLFFQEGIEALLVAWKLPEYSHGPLIPILSGFLFLKQLKDVPVNTGVILDRWPGVVMMVAAVALAMIGKLSRIDDIVAYGLILWVGAMLLISFGWRTGKHFWPGVLHLVYMLPLPGVLYFKLSTWLQMVSSELGVWFLQLMNISVFLDGNIIDLGVYKLHVAEACSGLRYLFPILSFSYIFAALYRGPMWHKAVLLLAAAPITVIMNSVRIAFAGWLVEYAGIEHLEGFTHFFEGWVIFTICILVLFALAWVMLQFNAQRTSLVDALDLDTDGLMPQLARIRFVQASRAMITAFVFVAAATTAWQLRPAPAQTIADRAPFVMFPRQMGEWRSSRPTPLSPEIEAALGADDYHSVDFRSPGSSATVGLFMAYYEDQTKGGVHSPEICLPSAGWEIAWLERVDIGSEIGLGRTFNINRAIIQKGEQRMMAYYWFEQHGRHVALDYAAKFWLVWDGITLGRTDGALARLITPIENGETDTEAEARLQSLFLETIEVLPRFVPVDPSLAPAG